MRPWMDCSPCAPARNASVPAVLVFASRTSNETSTGWSPASGTARRRWLAPLRRAHGLGSHLERPALAPEVPAGPDVQLGLVGFVAVGDARLADRDRAKLCGLASPSFGFGSSSLGKLQVVRSPSFQAPRRFVHRCGADDAAAQQRPDLERPAHAARVHEIRLRRPVRIRDAQHSDFELRRPHRPDAHALDVDFPPEALGEAFDAPFGPSRLHRHHRRQQHTQYADQDREHGNSAARGDFPVLHATGEALAVPMRARLRRVSCFGDADCRHMPQL